MSSSPAPPRQRPEGERLGRGALAALLVTVVVLGSVGGMGVLELTLAVLMAHPPSRSFLNAARQYYYFWERRLIQFLPECSQYDAELTYTLKPGQCRFRNREFSTEIRANRAGFRSDADDQVAPAVVLLGDSYALGWGVPMDSTLAALVERRTGLSTLSAAMASYGTAREVLSLRRVNLSAAKYLLIQYCDNDFNENLGYVRAGGRLQTLGRAAYDSLVADHLQVTRYYPGKYLRRLLPIARDVWLGRIGTLGPTTKRDYQREAETFVQVLLLSPARLDQLRIVVFELEPLVSNGPQFADALRQEVRRPVYPDWIRTMAVVDVSPRLSQADYFVYDDHLRASGYAKVGDLLVQEIAGRRSGSELRKR